MSDEEPENQESQTDSMKEHLHKMNKKYEAMIEGLKSADRMMI